MSISIKWGCIKIQRTAAKLLEVSWPESALIWIQLVWI